MPYLVTSLVIALGGGLVFLQNLYAREFLLSGIFMYMFALRFFKHEGKAFITTVLYQFAPFHLVDLVVRGDIAEGYALAFLPLVLFGLQRGFEEKNTRYNILLTVFAVTLLITSHNAISLVFFIVAVLYFVVFALDNHKLFVMDWFRIGTHAFCVLLAAGAY